jgi:1-phosphofructokinase family hexose kinase
MILVVCLNPALDITHHVAGTDWAGVNRPFAVHGRAGGKGLNAARTLRALGQQVTVAGLAGGSTGQAVLDGLAGTGIVADFTPIAGETRRTFAVADSASGQTALFNEPGPAVAEDEYREFVRSYEKLVASSQLVVLSGSLPPGVPENAYAGLITAAAGVPALLDASGTALALGAAAGPAIVKPNLAELEEAAGRPLRGPDGPELDAVERAARTFRGAGPGAVVVSLGSDGLLAVTPEGTWHARPPGHVPGNPTGAGDAVAAGLADASVRGLDWPASLRHAVALGTAAVRTPVAGEFAPADYERLVTTVEIVGAA